MYRTSSYQVLETAVGPDELADAARRVTPQREDVPDPKLSAPLQDRARLLNRCVHAREMRHRRDLVLPLNPVDDGKRLVAGASPGPIGNRAEIRLQLPQGGNRFLEQGPVGILRPGGEELEGDHRAAICVRLFEDVAYEPDQGRYGGPRNGEDASRSCRYRESPPCVIVVQRSTGRSVRSSVVPSGQVMRTRTAPAASPRPRRMRGSLADA